MRMHSSFYYSVSASKQKQNQNIYHRLLLDLGIQFKGPHYYLYFSSFDLSEASSHDKKTPLQTKKRMESQIIVRKHRLLHHVGLLMNLNLILLFGE